MTNEEKLAMQKEVIILTKQYENMYIAATPFDENAKTMDVAKDLEINVWDITLTPVVKLITESEGNKLSVISPITQVELESMNLSKEDLYENIRNANKHTWNQLSCVFTNELVEYDDLKEQPYQIQDYSEKFEQINNSKVACELYFKHNLKAMADKLNNDLLIAAGSLNTLLILPIRDEAIGVLQQYIHELRLANQNNGIETIGEHIYHYERDSGQLSIALTPAIKYTKE